MTTPMPTLQRVKKWWPDREPVPKLGRGRDGSLRIYANGTRTCSGGWELLYEGVIPGAVYELEVEVAYEELDHPREMLGAIVIWGKKDPQAPVDRLIPERTGVNARRLVRIVQAPPETDSVTLRCFFRWSPKGSSIWSLPVLRPASLPQLRPARVCVVTGSRPRMHSQKSHVIEDNMRLYAGMCERACRTVKPDLVALPEIALHWGLPESPFKTAVPIPSKETDVFAAIARKHNTYLVLGLYEREGDAVFNCAVLFDRRGRVASRYHKVHLAHAESFSGLLPGDGFPVSDTDIGCIGCNICMDISVVEASRAACLNGADFLVLPIMGDYRADRYSPGPPIHNDDRWRAIMRVRAMDNQLTMVVARNEGEGSCVIDRKGGILAYNEGDLDFIWADVPARQPYRAWCGACIRDVNGVQRRPHLYREFVDEANYSNVRLFQTTGRPPRGPT